MVQLINNIERGIPENSIIISTVDGEIKGVQQVTDKILHLIQHSIITNSTEGDWSIKILQHGRDPKVYVNIGSTTVNEVERLIAMP